MYRIGFPILVAVNCAENRETDTDCSEGSYRRPRRFAWVGGMRLSRMLTPVEVRFTQLLAWLLLAASVLGVPANRALTSDSVYIMSERFRFV